MKFLCSSCGAKYQIADEKVAGRVLRMKCRKCSHDILIDGQVSKSGRPAGPVSAAPRPGPSALSMPAAPLPSPTASPDARRSSALSQDFQNRVSHRPPPTPRASPLDQWHVAVNNVPVGPIGRAEILRKINAGAIKEDSLSWREGFDDWRPLREIPELAALLRQSTAPRQAPPPMSRSSVPPPPARTSRPVPQPHRAGDDLRQSRSNVVPIGGRMGAAAAYDLEPAPQAAPAEAVPAPAAAMPVSAADSTSHSTDSRSHSGVAPWPGAPAPVAAPSSGPGGLPVGAWIAIAGAAAFGIAFASIAASRMFPPPEPERAPAAEVAEPAPEAPAPEAPKQVAVVTDVPPEEEPLEEVVVEEPSASRGSRATPKATTKAPEKQLTAAEKARLEAMAGSSNSQFDKFKDSSGANLNLGKKTTASGGSLSADQLRSVVSKNQTSIKRCWETTLRAVGKASDVRATINLTIGASGTVQKVSASGANLPGLGKCLEGAVKRWRFPTAGEATSTQFPVVFQGTE
ncbi:MAG: zinc-ribbon domain-containing protein [Myxococcales bacterium]|nr:zinc-ribbon domain-containing protein [Myxococcales bacterium]